MVGYGKFNKDYGITALRNNVHVLKRHCQNATEAGLLHVCSSAVIVQLVSALPVHRGSEGALQTLSVMARSLLGPWGVRWEGMRSPVLGKEEEKRRLFHLFHTSETRVRFLLVMKESRLGTSLLPHCGGHTVGHAGKGNLPSPLPERQSHRLRR